MFIVIIYRHFNESTHNVVINMNSRLESVTDWISCYFVQILFMGCDLSEAKGQEVGRRECSAMGGNAARLHITPETRKYRVSTAPLPTWAVLSNISCLRKCYCCTEATGSNDIECVLATAARAAAGPPGAARLDLHQQQQTWKLLYSSQIKAQMFALGLVKH